MFEFNGIEDATVNGANVILYNVCEKRENIFEQTYSVFVCKRAMPKNYWWGLERWTLHDAMTRWHEECQAAEDDELLKNLGVTI